jgi:hypothetical protein
VEESSVSAPGNTLTPRILLALLVAIVLSFSSAILVRSEIAGATEVPPCSSTVLSLSQGFSEGAAGNEGTPILITNNGRAACTIAGYPIVTAHTEAASPHPVTFVRRPRSQIYTDAPVREVVIAPRAKASFGISYVDGDVQRDGEGRDCLVSSIAVSLPRVAPARKIVVVFRKGSDGYGGPINACFAGFEFGLSPIVRGPIPPEH